MVSGVFERIANCVALLEGAPNVCPVPLVGKAEAPVILNGEMYELVIATVPDEDPIVLPYIIILLVLLLLVEGLLVGESMIVRGFILDVQGMLVL